MELHSMCLWDWLFPLCIIPIGIFCLHVLCVCAYICLCMCAQLCLILCNTLDCSPPGSSVHAIFQTRILEWVAISYSGESGRQILYHCVTWEGPTCTYGPKSLRGFLFLFWTMWQGLLNEYSASCCHGGTWSIGCMSWVTPGRLSWCSTSLQSSLGLWNFEHDAFEFLPSSSISVLWNTNIFHWLKILALSNHGPKNQEWWNSSTFSCFFPREAF